MVGWLVHGLDTVGHPTPLIAHPGAPEWVIVFLRGYGAPRSGGAVGLFEAYAARLDKNF